VTQKRRNRYYRIASPLVAKMLESIKAVAAIDVPPRYQPRSTQDDRLRFARTCYDHLAGQLGVAIADALVSKDVVDLLRAFDINRERIHAIAAKVYARGRRGTYDLNADDV
jgi:hypothetical protein